MQMLFRKILHLVYYWYSSHYLSSSWAILDQRNAFQSFSLRVWPQTNRVAQQQNHVKLSRIFWYPSGRSNVNVSSIWLFDKVAQAEAKYSRLQQRLRVRVCIWLYLLTRCLAC